MDITHETVATRCRWIRHTVDPDIDYDGSGLEHVTCDSLCPPHRGNHDVSLSDILYDITRTGMHRSHHCVGPSAFLQQHVHHWLADDITSSYNDHMFSGRVVSRTNEKLPYSGRSAWLKRGKADYKTTHVHRVKPIHIFPEINLL